jgi:hypothetical protein
MLELQTIKRRRMLLGMLLLVLRMVWEGWSKGRNIHSLTIYDEHCLTICVHEYEINSYRSASSARQRQRIEVPLALVDVQQFTG